MLCLHFRTSWRHWFNHFNYMTLNDISIIINKFYPNYFTLGVMKWGGLSPPPLRNLFLHQPAIPTLFSLSCRNWFKWAPGGLTSLCIQCTFWIYLTNPLVANGEWTEINGNIITESDRSAVLHLLTLRCLNHHRFSEERRKKAKSATLL